MSLLQIILSSGLILYLAKEGVAVLKEWYKQRKENFDIVLPKVSEIYEEMNYLLKTVKAGRVIVLKAHNGGGRPSVGTQLYSSAVYEAWDDLKSIKDHWQQQPLDEEYCNILVDLDRHGALYIDTVKMEDGVLKELYFANHILHSVVVKIKQDEKALYYLSINFSSPTDIHEPSIKEAVRSSVNKLKRLWG